MKHILKCETCNKYTMEEVCSCRTKTIVPRPVKFSIDDKFSSYRRKAKIEEYQKRGLI